MSPSTHSGSSSSSSSSSSSLFVSVRFCLQHIEQCRRWMNVTVITLKQYSTQHIQQLRWCQPQSSEWHSSLSHFHIGSSTVGQHFNLIRVSSESKSLPQHLAKRRQQFHESHSAVWLTWFKLWIKEAANWTLATGMAFFYSFMMALALRMTLEFANI